MPRRFAYVNIFAMLIDWKIMGVRGFWRAWHRVGSAGASLSRATNFQNETIVNQSTGVVFALLLGSVSIHAELIRVGQPKVCRLFFEADLVDAIKPFEVVAEYDSLIVLEYSASLAVRPIVALSLRRLGLVYGLVLKLNLLFRRKAPPKRIKAP